MIRPRPGDISSNPINCSIIAHLGSISREYEEKKVKEKQRKGRKRKNQVTREINLSDPTTQGEMLRNFTLTSLGSEERKATYKLRTLIERIFSILKSLLGFAMVLPLNSLVITFKQGIWQYGYNRMISYILSISTLLRTRSANL